MYYQLWSNNAVHLSSDLANQYFKIAKFAAITMVAIKAFVFPTFLLDYSLCLLVLTFCTRWREVNNEIIFHSARVRGSCAG